MPATGHVRHRGIWSCFTIKNKVWIGYVIRVHSPAVYYVCHLIAQHFEQSFSTGIFHTSHVPPSLTTCRWKSHQRSIYAEDSLQCFVLFDVIFFCRRKKRSSAFTVCDLL